MDPRRLGAGHSGPAPVVSSLWEAVIPTGVYQYVECSHDPNLRCSSYLGEEQLYAVEVLLAQRYEKHGCVITSGEFCGLKMRAWPSLLLCLFLCILDFGEIRKVGPISGGYD